MTTKTTITPATHATPKFVKLHYEREGDSLFFSRVPTLVPFRKVPIRLTVETTWRDDIRRNGAEYTIHDGKPDGMHDFFTGLLPVPDLTRVYVGNKIETESQYSLCLFVFTADFGEFDLYFFPEWFIYNRAKRFTFIQDFLGDQ